MIVWHLGKSVHSLTLLLSFLKLQKMQKSSRVFCCSSQCFIYPSTIDMMQACIIFEAYVKWQHLSTFLIYISIYLILTWKRACWFAPLCFSLSVCHWALKVRRCCRRCCSVLFCGCLSFWLWGSAWSFSCRTTDGCSSNMDAFLPRPKSGRLVFHYI